MRRIFTLLPALLLMLALFACAAGSGVTLTQTDTDNGFTETERVRYVELSRTHMGELVTELTMFSLDADGLIETVKTRTTYPDNETALAAYELTLPYLVDDGGETPTMAWMNRERNVIWAQATDAAVRAQYGALADAEAVSDYLDQLDLYAAELAVDVANGFYHAGGASYTLYSQWYDGGRLCLLDCLYCLDADGYCTAVKLRYQYQTAAEAKAALEALRADIEGDAPAYAWAVRDDTLVYAQLTDALVAAEFSDMTPEETAEYLTDLTATGAD